MSVSLVERMACNVAGRSTSVEQEGVGMIHRVDRRRSWTGVVVQW